MQFVPENGLTENERRYQGLLRKQRLELNYLLKDRERLLEAQQKLSALTSSQPSNEKNGKHNGANNKTKGGSKSSAQKKDKAVSLQRCFWSGRVGLCTFGLVGLLS